VSDSAPRADPAAQEPADLVVQGPDLSPEAIDAFRRRFASAPLQRRAGSIRLAAVGPAPALAAEVAQLAAHWRCDAALVSPQLQLARFRLLALDMDSTLVRIECLDELAQLAGVGPEVAAITDAAMRGLIADYSESLRRRVALLAGVDAALLQVVAEQRLALSPGAERLLATARGAGLRTLLVTGGFTYFARIVQRRLDIDRVCANEVQVRDGRLTGVVHGPDGGSERLVDAQGKASALQQACAEFGCSGAQAIAIGDGANDLPMLALAGLSVAYHAKPRVRAAAACALDYSGLDGVLEWFTDTAAALTPNPSPTGVGEGSQG
jgi:phosphoserine phosphatase